MLFGFIMGTTLATLFYLFLTQRFLCRVGWHRWTPWGLADSGNGQFRMCERCAYHDCRMFLGFAFVREPKKITPPPCADCLDTGFKVTEGRGVERCIHSVDAAPTSEPETP